MHFIKILAAIFFSLIYFFISFPFLESKLQMNSVLPVHSLDWNYLAYFLLYAGSILFLSTYTVHFLFNSKANRYRKVLIEAETIEVKKVKKIRAEKNPPKLSDIVDPQEIEKMN